MSGELHTLKGLGDTLVVLGAAGIVIPAFARFRISPVIGFILVGLLVGPHGLGSLTEQYPFFRHITITSPEAIQPFAEFGIVLLLFTIGLELSFKRLFQMRKLVFGVGAAELAVSGLIIGTALWLMGQGWAGAMGLGLALALSSTALVLQMVGTSGPVGRPAFAMLLFEDLALVPIIFALGVLSPHAQDSGWDGLLRTLWIGGLTVGALLLAGRFLLPSLFAQAARTKSPELFLAVSLLTVILASLATTAAGLSPIVGALLAGLLIAETEYHGEVEVMTAPFKGLALGVFLLTVGMSLDFRVIGANWLPLAIAVVGVVLVKTMVTAGMLRLIGIRLGTAAETGLLMAAPSETTLIVLSAATAAGLIMPSTAAFWQIVTAIGLTITPILAKIGHDFARRLELRDDGDGAMPGETGEAPGTVIIGFGRVGRLVADMLKTHNRPFIAVEANIDAVTAARREGYPVIFGDVARSELVDKLNLGRAEALVLTMDDPVLSVRLTRRVRSWVPDLTIMARARDTDHAAQLYKAGATEAVPETLESSLQLSEAVLVELGVAMGPVIASIHDKRANFRDRIRDEAKMTREPRLGRIRKADVAEESSTS